MTLNETNVHRSPKTANSSITSSPRRDGLGQLFAILSDEIVSAAVFIFIFLSRTVDLPVSFNISFEYETFVKLLALPFKIN